LIASQVKIIKVIKKIVYQINAWMFLRLLLQELKIVIVLNKKMKYFLNVQTKLIYKKYKIDNKIALGKLYSNLICFKIKNLTLYL